MEPVDHTDDGRKSLFAVGGVVGAILASSCCIAPLLLITLGVSGAWMGSLTLLAPYQAYFIAATLVFLAMGFWYVYWKPKKDCADGSYCASPTSDRVVKIALWLATALIAVALGVNLIFLFRSPQVKSTLIAIVLGGFIGVSAPSFAAEQTVSMDIERMTCALCPLTVRKAMERVDGVQQVEVDFDSKTATVTFDDAKTTAIEIAQASTDVGYPATPAAAAESN